MADLLIPESLENADWTKNIPETLLSFGFDTVEELRDYMVSEGLTDCPLYRLVLEQLGESP